MTHSLMRLHFDRGTVVITGDPPDSLLDDLTGVRWDARIQRYRAPAFEYRRLVTTLRARGVAFQDDVRARRVRTQGWMPVALRPYQHAALLAWDAQRRGVIVLPTGSGKTRVACAAMAACRIPSLCLVPTRVLLHQWRSELARHYSGAIGCLGDGARAIEDVTIATFEGAYRQMDRLGDQFGLLVVDEMHHFGAGMRDEVLEMCAAPRRLGLTATTPSGEALSQLVDLLGPVVYELGIGDLTGQWLAEFEERLLGLTLTAAEQQRYDAAVQRFRAVFDRFRSPGQSTRWSDFVATASHSEAGRAALAAFRHSRRLTNYPEAKRAALGALLAEHRGSRILVFTADNETAYSIAREHFIMPITCDIDRREREEALGAFRAGELKALVSAQVLNEGIDVPDADVAIIVGGVRGGREHVQRVGRLLRPSPGKHALVYELVMLGTHEQRKSSERRRALRPAIARI